jgi:hypothetical protein
VPTWDRKGRADVAREADEREHRRGLVLGLTLAEMLLLLLFLLLIAIGAIVKDEIERLQGQNQQLGAQLAEAQSALKAAEPLLFQALKEEDLETLVARLARLEQTEATLATKHNELEALRSSMQTAQKHLAEMRSELEEHRSKIARGEAELKPLLEARQLMAELKRFDPQSPPAVSLKRLTELAREAEGSKAVVAANAELGRKLEYARVREEQMNKQLVEVTTQFAALRDEADKTRRERDNLKKGPGGTFPSCWTTPEGRTEFMFNITIRDTGLTVRNIAPPSRAGDAAWKLLDPLSYGTDVAANSFRGATARLFAWSKQQECRFFAEIKDLTGATAKDLYKSSRQAIEDHFYIRHLENERRKPQPRPRAAPSNSASAPL